MVLLTVNAIMGECAPAFHFLHHRRITRAPPVVLLCWDSGILKVDERKAVTAMSYPMNLTSVLTGATPSQLQRWRTTGLVVPEVQPFRPPLYSFRDLMLLRSIVFLRAHTSSQKIHRAFNNLRTVKDDLGNAIFAFEHPSEFHFGVDGDTIYLGTASGEAIDILKRVGQPTIFSFEDMLAAFSNFKQAPVPELARPSEHLELRPTRMSGWPTISNTRVPYDLIARLVDNKTVFPDDVPDYYPTVSAEAARDAVEFNARVEAVA